MELQKLLVTLALDAKDYTKGLDDAAREAQTFGQRARGGLGKAFGAIRTVGTAAFLGVGAAAVLGFGGAMREAIDMNSTLETATLQFGTLMGDSDKAAEHVAGLFDFAARTPFETGPILTASKHLQVFGGDALNSMDNLTLVGDAAAALGVPFDEAAFWVGRLYSNLEGGQPFGEAAMRLQEMGIMTPQARAELEAMQEAGADGNQIFSTFQGQLGTFTGAMEDQAGTWQGLTSTIKDQLALAAAEGLKPFFDLAKEGMAGLAEWLQSPEVKAGIASLAEGITTLVERISVFVTEQVVPFVQEHGPKIITVLKILAVAFGALMIIGAITTVLGLLLSPIGLVAAAIGILAVAWASNWGGIQEKTQAVIDFIRPYIETAIANIRAFIETTLAAIRAFWEDHGQGILDFTRGIWETIKLAISGFLDAIMLIFQAFKQLFSGDWEGLGETLKELWQNAWDTITGVLAKLWETFEPLFTSLWTSIKTWWNGIDWAGLGRNLIDGVVKGIKNAGDSIRSTLMGFAQAAWDAVKAFFGIASPSKLMAYAGEMIGAGLIEGIEGTQRDLDRAMTKLSVGAQLSMESRLALVGDSGRGNTDNSRRTTIYGGIQVNRDTSLSTALDELYGMSR